MTQKEKKELEDLFNPFNQKPITLGQKDKKHCGMCGIKFENGMPKYKYHQGKLDMIVCDRCKCLGDLEGCERL